MTKPIYKWKFLRLRGDTIVSDHKATKWKLGEWKSVRGSISTCSNGFHCSDTIPQALSYVKGEVLARVEVRGDNEIKDDKSAWREMRIVTAYRWTAHDSVRYAIYAVEQVIKIYEAKYPDDPRPRDAIRAARAYLKQPSAARAARAACAARAADAAYATRAAAYAARAAAHAAHAAARAAHAAARAAYAADAADAAAYAADAADAAAYATTYAATRAAAYAARAELNQKLSRWMNRHVKNLEVIT